MYDTFCYKHPGIKVSFVFFRRYFKENFNLRFGRPQIDVCSKCEELGCKIKSSVLNENAKKGCCRRINGAQKESPKFLARNENIKRKYS